MNGEPLDRAMGAVPLIVPRWYAVASVKWLKRIDVLTEPYSRRVPDRPLHVRVARPPAGARDFMRVRARITDPAARLGHPPPAPTRCGARPGREPGRSRSVDVSFTGAGDWHAANARSARGALSVAGVVAPSGRPTSGTPHNPCEGDRRRRQRATRRAALEPARLRQQRHRRAPRRRQLVAGGRTRSSLERSGPRRVIPWNGPSQPLRSR